MSMIQDNLSQKHRLLGMLCHLSSIVWVVIAAIFVVSTVVESYQPNVPGSMINPLMIASGIVTALALILCPLIPLVVWLITRRIHPFVDEQGRESLNFQISIFIYDVTLLLISAFLFFATCGILITSGGSEASSTLFVVTLIALWALFMVLLFIDVSLVLIAAIKAYQGQSYRYPFNLRFLR